MCNLPDRSGAEACIHSSNPVPPSESRYDRESSIAVSSRLTQHDYRLSASAYEERPGVRRGPDEVLSWISLPAVGGGHRSL